MGLGEVLEYCASKGLVQADAPLCDCVTVCHLALLTLQILKLSQNEN